MIFIGAGFFGGYQSITATNVNPITDVQLQNGKFDTLFISKNGDEISDLSSLKWTYNTVLYAMFNGTLLAGNLNTAISTISAVLVKQREYGTYTWKTIYEIPITQASDFQFSKVYRYCKGNKTEYEFALVPIINETEGEYYTNNVISDFEGFYLTEKDVSYQLLLNTEFSVQHIKPSTTITTLGRKKPYYISNGAAQYDTGSVTATFIPVTSDGKSFDFDSATKYRHEINQFLHNGNPKILKHFDGRTWMVNIDSEFPEDTSKHWQMPIHTINWTEVGETDNMGDMYDNNFIDTDIDR